MRPRIEWPKKIPKVHYLDEWNVIDRMTFGREVGGIEITRVEKRARNLMYYYGAPPGELSGSQVKWCLRHPYYTELFAHEMGHLFHMGWELKQLVGCGVSTLTEALKYLTREEGDENEIEAAATASLVLEYLGFPYNLSSLVRSTTSNLFHYRERYSVYHEVRFQRFSPRTQQIARHLCHLLLKIKHVENERDSYQEVRP